MQFLVLYVHIIISVVILAIINLKIKSIDKNNLEMISYIVFCFLISILIAFFGQYMIMDNKSIILLIFYFGSIIYNIYVLVLLVKLSRQRKKDE